MSCQRAPVPSGFEILLSFVGMSAVAERETEADYVAAQVKVALHEQLVVVVEAHSVEIIGVRSCRGQRSDLHRQGSQVIVVSEACIHCKQKQHDTPEDYPGQHLSAKSGALTRHERCVEEGQGRQDEAQLGQGRNEPAPGHTFVVEALSRIDVVHLSKNRPPVGVARLHHRLVGLPDRSGAGER